MNIAVVIPYFQRQPGILQQAIGSVMRQRLPAGAEVTVLVVDDASPSPPEPELVAAGQAPGVSVRILKKSNGGPGSARNLGLDHVPPDADLVAFLDSDDAWEPHHLAEAVDGLAHADVYFSDNWYEAQRRWFEGLEYFAKPPVSALHQAVPGSQTLFLFPGRQVLAPLTHECLPHTSTVVYRFPRHSQVRFDERLRYAGEDHLFWLRLAAAADGVAFSTRPGARRGEGVSVYRSALEWGNPHGQRRLIYRLMLHKAIQREFAAFADEAELRRTVSQLENGVAYLMARNALRHPLISARALGLYLTHDPIAALKLPYTMPRALWRRVRGRLDFPNG